MPHVNEDFIIGQDDLVLVTGASGFIGSRLVQTLLDFGIRKLRCFVRPSSDVSSVEALATRYDRASIELIKGNLLSRDDCRAATKNVSVIFHLAAARGEKFFPEAFLNSVVTTRNLLEAAHQGRCLQRFVAVSSFTVYTNVHNRKWRLLDESSEVESKAHTRGDAYCFAKVKQEEIVKEYGHTFGIPYVILRPGHVYGPGNEGISGRVGIGTFGLFLHLGGSNPIPFTYVDNCADAIALAGLKKGVDGQVFNVVDDGLLSSRQFLRSYKRNVKYFRSLYIPHCVSYCLCYLWERYSNLSKGQLPPAFNRSKWRALWKKTHYSNDKLKTQVGWNPKVSTADGMRLYFESCRDEEQHA